MICDCGNDRFILGNSNSFLVACTSCGRMNLDYTETIANLEEAKQKLLVIMLNTGEYKIVCAKCEGVEMIENLCSGFKFCRKCSSRDFKIIKSKEK